MVERQKKTEPLRYSWSVDGEFYEGAHTTRAEAVREAIREHELFEGDAVCVGEACKVSARSLVREWVNGYDILDQIQDFASGNYAHADDWPNVPRENREAMDDAVADAIAPFLDEPRFWPVTNIMTVKVTADDLAIAYRGLNRCRFCFDVPLESQQCTRRGGPCEVLPPEIADAIDRVTS